MKPHTWLRFNHGDPVIAMEVDGYLTLAEAIEHGHDIIAKAMLARGPDVQPDGGPALLPDALPAATTFDCVIWQSTANDPVLYRVVDGKTLLRRDTPNGTWRVVDGFTVEQVMARNWYWSRVIR